MKNKVTYNKNIIYMDTLLISAVLSTVTLPLLWILSGASISWVLTAVILWTIGVFAIFHPFVRYIFPMMLTKAGTFILSALLAILSIWINLNVLFLILPADDIELIFNQSLFRISLASSAMFVWFYILIAGVIVSNLSLRLSTIIKTNRRFLQIFKRTPLFTFNLFKHYSEILLIFILPIALLFWVEVTYSTRVLLALISISMGVGIFIQRLHIEVLLKKVIASIAVFVTILAINISFVNIFGLDMLPTDNLKIRIAGDSIGHDIKSESIDYPKYQINNSTLTDNASLYKIVSSIPQIGLHIGYRIAKLPNETIEVKATKDYYTVENQYQERLFTIKR